MDVTKPYNKISDEEFQKLKGTTHETSTEYVAFSKTGIRAMFPLHKFPKGGSLQAAEFFAKSMFNECFSFIEKFNVDTFQIDCDLSLLNDQVKDLYSLEKMSKIRVFM